MTAVPVDLMEKWGRVNLDLMKKWGRVDQHRARRATSLIRVRTPLGPYHRRTPRALGGS